jgi:hypothetical protein
MLYNQILNFVRCIKKTYDDQNKAKDFRFNLYDNLNIIDPDFTNIEMEKDLDIIRYKIQDTPALIPAPLPASSSSSSSSSTRGATGATGTTAGTTGTTGATGVVTGPDGIIIPTGRTGTATGTSLSPAKKALIEKLIDIATSNDFNTKVKDILKLAGKFKIGSSSTEHNSFNKDFTKALELLNKNLTLEGKLTSIPKSVKSYKTKLPNLTFVTKKLTVELSDDKGPTTSKGKELEELIINNRNLISDVSDSLNTTPRDAIRELNTFINSISRWVPTSGSSPFRYFKDEYKAKYDNFFINRENVEGFIEELKKTIYKNESDENKKILIGKFFQYLPNFVGSKNLTYYRNEYGIPTSEYVKAYKESIKKKDKKKKSKKDKKKSKRSTRKSTV